MKRQKRDIRSFFKKKINKEVGEISTPIPTEIPPSEVPQESPQTTEDETIGVGLNPTYKEALINDDGRLTALDVINLPHDPGKRKKISDFHPDDRDIVRRAYIQRKLCQPKDFEFPSRRIGVRDRRFNSEWFKTHESWLEYSVENDAVFCFPCYLFKDENSVGVDAFVGVGFRAWNKTEAYKKHIGGHMSAHNQAVRSLNDFKNQETSITSCLNKQSKINKSNYFKRLQASIKCLRWLLLQGLQARGHNEKEDSLNRGNFIKLLKFYAMDNLDVHKVILENAPQNSQMISPTIQKDIINACAKETTKALLEEVGDGFFAILADESADISDKEQMALCLRYVNKRGEVTERFLGIVHVANTTSLTLKGAIESLLMEHSLTFSSVRGQGYDGASNMQGAINGLKTLILSESSSAYYVHCFSHQLQLTLVVVAKKNADCGWLFVDVLAPLLNFVGGSLKRKEFLRQKQAEAVVKALSTGDLESGTSLNQELRLSRPGDTRWGSHYRTILHVINLYPTILTSLDAIGEVSDSIDKNRAESLTHLLMSFDFVFLAHLIVDIFGITNELNVALQKSDQDVVNAMSLVNVAKVNFQEMRDNGWDSLINKVISFMIKHGLQDEIPDMEGKYIVPGRRKFRGGAQPPSNLHHFRVEVFMSVIDLQLQELDSRFDEKSKELLICMSCFNPSNNFSSFNVEKLVRLAEFYPHEFPDIERHYLEGSLRNFIIDIRNDDRFLEVKNLNDFSVKLVETQKHETHSRVYLLLKLVLVLPVAMASVERAFSKITQIKSKLRSTMCDQLLNDCLVSNLEKDLFLKASIDDIVNQFQNMRSRREQL